MPTAQLDPRNQIGIFEFLRVVERNNWKSSLSKVARSFLQILKCLIRRLYCWGFGRQVYSLSYRWWGPLARWLIWHPHQLLSGYGKHFLVVHYLYQLVLDRSQELNSVPGFETALNARVHGEVTLNSQTKKSIKYSYLLTQCHKHWTTRAGYIL